MSDTHRTIKGIKYQDRHMRRYPGRKPAYRKSFVWHGENWSTVANGGPGNKRCWNITKDRHWIKDKLDRAIDEF